MNDETTGQPADAAAATDTTTTAAAPAPEAATETPAADAAPTTETSVADEPAGEAPAPETTDTAGNIQTETELAETESPTSLAARVAALEDYMHKLGTAVTADIATLKADITAEATQAEGVLAHFELWLKNLAEAGVRSVEHLFGGNAE